MLIYPVTTLQPGPKLIYPFGHKQIEVNQIQMWFVSEDLQRAAAELQEEPGVSSFEVRRQCCSSRILV